MHTQDVKSRRGITLMEVLISIFVVSIGLFGVLALIPLAGHQAQLGLIEDAKAVVGQNAFREFDIREMRQPTNWLVRGTSTAAFNAGQSYCIDPRFAAFHAGPPAPPAQADFFPYVTGANPRMQRITLRSAPSAGAMTQEQADNLFVSADELVFNAPDDKTLPPVQEFRLDSSNNFVKRQTLPNMSWMATVVPKLKAPNDPMPDPDLYVLSIVVFYKRDHTFSTAASSASTNYIANERLATVQSFYGSGITGGDMQLTAASAEDLTVRQGDWVMLCGNWPAGGVNTLPIFRWYRVLAADDPDNSSGPWTRDVTLLGGDWTLANVPGVTTQVVLMKDVVAVYEKTIRLETSSLWTQ